MSLQYSKSENNWLGTGTCSLRDRDSSKWVSRLHHWYIDNCLFWHNGQSCAQKMPWKPLDFFIVLALHVRFTYRVHFSVVWSIRICFSRSPFHVSRHFPVEIHSEFCGNLLKLPGRIVDNLPHKSTVTWIHSARVQRYMLLLGTKQRHCC